MKAGIVGLGKMGLTHAAVLEALAPGTVAALVEADPGARSTLKSLGLGAPVYPDLDAMLARETLDAAFVCTPTFTHDALVRTLIAARIPCLVEKPVAETLAKASALAALAEKTGALVAVGYSAAQDPLFAEARRLLAAGAIGRPKRYRAWVEHAEVFGPKKGWLFQKPLSGGGVVINPAPHMLWLVLESFGEPASLRAELRSPYSTVEDEARVELLHADGLEGRLDASWSVPGKPALELALYVEGESGTLAVGEDELLVETAGRATRTHRSALSADGAFDLAPAAGASNYSRQDRLFLDDVRLKRRPANSLQATLRVDRLIDAIYRSAERKEAVAWS